MQKVLVITYYWPPAGGPGVQRWLKFVKYLRDYGVEPLVYLPENPHYPIMDESLVQEIPKGITYYKNKISEPYRLSKWISSKKTKRISSGIIETENPSLLEKLMLWIRGNFFIPDARKNWVAPSVDYLNEILSKENIETIITTGPPHSVHLIGQQLREKHQITWLADFRDPWTSIGYHKKLRLTQKSQEKHKELEHLVLNKADKIIVTSPTTKEFERITSKPVEVITNGYDSDYQGNVNLDDNFTISHIGSLLTGRNPKNLWKVLSDMARENEIFRTELQLEFIGVISKEVLDSLYHHELAPYLKLRGYVSHSQAIRRQQRSQVLLLAEIDSEETKGIIPGKLFEYMAARRPILSIGPNDWDAGAIVTETNTGANFNYKDYSDLKKTLLDWYSQYRKKGLKVSPRNSRKELTRALAWQISEL